LDGDNAFGTNRPAGTNSILPVTVFRYFPLHRERNNRHLANIQQRLYSIFLEKNPLEKKKEISKLPPSNFQEKRTSIFFWEELQTNVGGSDRLELFNDTSLSAYKE
jgi:hypothetical protein